MLVNEKYVGTIVFNRVSYKLKSPPVRNPEAMWVRKVTAFAPAVPATLFQKAQDERQRRARRFTDAEMLDGLRALYAGHGRVSGLLDQPVGELAHIAELPL